MLLYKKRINKDTTYRIMINDISSFYGVSDDIGTVLDVSIVGNGERYGMSVTFFSLCYEDVMCIIQEKKKRSIENINKLFRLCKDPHINIFFDYEHSLEYFYKPSIEFGV